MKDEQLESLLRKYYPSFQPVRFPGADQQRYAGLVRSAIRNVFDSGGESVTVLDFGCGRGALELYDYRSENVRVCGVDINDAVLENPYLDEAKVCGDEIDYPNSTFDVICSAHVFEHISEPRKCLSELYRVLKPGGKLVVLTPNAYSLPALIARSTPVRFHAWLNSKRGLQEKDTFPTFYRLNTRRSLATAARRAGFTVDALDYWEGRPEYLLFTPLTFYLGLVWEKAVNFLPFLRGFRSSLFAVLGK